MCVCECSCCHNINCCTAVVAPIPFIALPHAICHLPFAAFAGSVFFFNIIICCWLVYPQFCFGFVRTLRYINFRLPLFKRFFIIFAFVFVLYFFIPFLFLHFSLIFRCFSFVVWCNLCYVFVVVVFLSVLFRFYLTARIDFPPVVVVIIAIRLFVFGSCL